MATPVTLISSVTCFSLLSRFFPHIFFHIDNEFSIVACLADRIAGCRLCQRTQTESSSRDLFVAQPRRSMAMWESDKFQEDENADIGGNFDNILVTHDLQDCLDTSLDLSSFEKVYEQSTVFDYENYSDDDGAINERLPVDDNTAE